MTREESPGAADLAAALSHEIRTPLFGIGIAAESLLQALSRQSDDPRYAHAIELARSITLQVERAGLTLDGLRALFQAESPTLPPGEPRTMAYCIQQAMEDYPFEPDNRKPRTDTRHDFDFYGRPELMSCVVLNLMRNAYHAIRSSGKGAITIKLERGERWNHLHFRDTGPGIRPELLEGIFHMGFTTKQSTGVGLALCRRIVESVGGTISCHSVLGEFTQFDVSLPALPAPAEEPA